MKRNERAGHIKRTVREIRHVQYAVNQRQPQRDETIHAAQRKSVQHLLEEKIHASVQEPANDANARKQSAPDRTRRFSRHTRHPAMVTMDRIDPCRHSRSSLI